MLQSQIFLYFFLADSCKARNNGDIGIARIIGTRLYIGNCGFRFEQLARNDGWGAIGHFATPSERGGTIGREMQGTFISAGMYCEIGLLMGLRMQCVCEIDAAGLSI